MTATPSRLLLFDVDGTLVRGGPGREALKTAMHAVFGTAGPIDDHEFSGKTDPQIARELLVDVGLDDAEIDTALPSLWERYLEGLAEELRHRPVEVLPGVPRLLEALEAAEDAALGLVTGNIARGARLKLASAQLDPWFPVGAYGSDAEERDRLPAVAVERARRRWGVGFAPGEVVVIGDTPRDVRCGRAGGHRTVAVATGRISRAALEEEAPDRIFEDLSATEEVVETLLGPRPGS